MFAVVNDRLLQTESPATSLRLRLARKLSLGLVGALLFALPAIAPAYADPVIPSTDEIEQSRQLARATANEVADLDVQIASLEANLDASVVGMLMAAEDYNQAVEEFEAAEAYALDAREQASAAEGRAKESRKFLVRLARESARSGKTLETFETVLSADGLESVVEKTNALTLVNDKADKRVQQFQADQVVAEVLREVANEATKVMETKKAAAGSALSTAQQKQMQSEMASGQAAIQRSGLMQQLAETRGTTVALEQQRQNGLAQQRADREARQAEERRQAQEKEDAKNAEVDAGTRPTAQPSAPAPGTSAPSAPAPSTPAPPAPLPSTPAPSTPAPRPTTTPKPTPAPTQTQAPAPKPTPAPTQTQAPTPTPPPVVTPPPPPVVTPPPPPPPVVTPPPPPVVAPPPPPVVTPKPPSTGGAYGLGTGSNRGSAGQGHAAVAEARNHIGKGYLLGAAGPSLFDCSGLTSVAWRAAGVSINRSSRSQYKQVLKIRTSEMRPGDLIFWGSNPNNPDSIWHVAMYIGGNQMIEAVSPGTPLKVSNIRWGNTMPYAGRP